VQIRDLNHMDFSAESACDLGRWASAARGADACACAIFHAMLTALWAALRLAVAHHDALSVPPAPEA
jgi:hypothetical protein